MAKTTPKQDPFVKRPKGETVAPAVVAPEPEPEPGLVPPSGTNKEVLAWVDGDKTRAQLALDAENAETKPRAGLVKALNEILEEGE